MEIPFHQKLVAAAKQSRLFAGVLVLLYFVWEAATHEFYTWFDDRVIQAAASFHPLIFEPTRWAIAHPVWLIVVFVGFYSFVLVVWALSPTRRPAVEIISLAQDELVDYQQVVHGTARNPNRSLQLFVHSPDKKWHPQWAPEFNHNNWRARCQFGSATSPAGNSYTVVAVSGANAIRDALSELPKEGVKSEIVTVRRSTTPPVQSAPGIYLGRIRRPLKADEWVSYTPKAGRVSEEDGSLQFSGTWENGFRYPREDTALTPATILGLRFKPAGEVNFYAHFRSNTLLINSRFSDWGIPQGQNEFRVPLPPTMLGTGWHVAFIFLPCLEQVTARSLDVLERFSVRGNLSISHVWGLSQLDQLPVSFLTDAIVLSPPVGQ